MALKSSIEVLWGQREMTSNLEFRGLAACGLKFRGLGFRVLKSMAVGLTLMPL